MIFPMTTAPPKHDGPRRFSRWIAAAALTATLVLGSNARAASDDEEELPDARLTGYEGKVDVGGGVAGSYALLAVLGAITIGVAFKNARRSHLD